jgi:hypothetical protein
MGWIFLHEAVMEDAAMLEGDLQNQLYYVPEH